MEFERDDFEQDQLDNPGKYKACPNCGEPGPHFVPPSCGDEGFFICEPKPAKLEAAVKEG